MKTHRIAGSLAVVMFGCLVACDHSTLHNTTPDVRSSPSGVTNAQARGDGQMVDELANARCDREAWCKNVGAGQKYASRDVCLDQMRGSIGNDPLDTLARLEECRTSDMCLK